MIAKLTLNLIAAGILLVASTETSPTYAQDFEVLGKALTLDLASRQFDKVAARFDERVAAAIPPAKLSAVWDGLLGQVGAFRAISGARVEEQQGYRLVFVTCEFERATLDVKITFDSTSRVTGLFIVPSQSKMAWVAADYAKQSAFHERQVNIGSGRWQLPGTLSIPSGTGPFPAVVLVHGSGPHDEDETIGPNKPFKDVAWGLASRNIAVLRYTKRTSKYGKEIHESLAGFTVQDETIDDARAAVALLATLPEINPKRIYVLGHSLGGMLAPRIATGDARITGLIIMAGNARSLEEMIVEQVKYVAGLGGKTTEAEQKQIEASEQAAQQIRSPALTPSMTISVLGTSTPGSYWLDLRGYHPTEAAAALKIPILVLQGERDYQVTLKDFEGWKKALAGRSNASFKLYPSLNHLFIAGTGPSFPAEYSKAGHVSAAVILDLADWISGRDKEGK